MRGSSGESSLQEALEKRPWLIRSGLNRIRRKVSFRVDNWLGKDESGLEWDWYKHGKKHPDLLLWYGDRTPILVIAELKWTAGEGDAGLLQLLDYYQMLIHDLAAQDTIRQELKLESMDAIVKNAELYLIVGGYVSELLKKRVGYIEESLQKRIKIFTATPPDKAADNDWEIEQAFPKVRSEAQ